MRMEGWDEMEGGRNELGDVAGGEDFVHASDFGQVNCLESMGLSIMQKCTTGGWISGHKTGKELQSIWDVYLLMPGVLES